MSVTELKEAVGALSIEERLDLAEYLRALAKREDPSWQMEVGRRLDRCLSGQGHTREDLHQLHERLYLNYESAL